MSEVYQRRELLKLMSVGGVVFASSLRAMWGCSSESAAPAGPRPGTPRGAQRDFFFVQVSDSHWGFSDDSVNPNASVELPNAIAQINGLGQQPDFVVFTGDLTHNTDDAGVRRQRMNEFKNFAAQLTAEVRFMPGEHDAAADGGTIYREIFGPSRYSFDHEGIHFVAIDNVSDPKAMVGDEQIQWLQADLQPLDAEAPIVVLAHRPLWDLRPDWDWATPDGQRVIDLLLPYHNVVVFFGHIHQELHHMTGHIAHHSARSIQFALPTPDTSGARHPIAWDPALPNAGLGFRSVEATPSAAQYALHEVELASEEQP